MDHSRAPRTDQKANVRPISFVTDFGRMGGQLTLPIRPEDLTITFPSRVSVHQTLGPEVQGWVDHFGAGLPTISISGHTGWGYKPGLGMDGFEAFEALHQIVHVDFADAIRDAVRNGTDPGRIRLIFADLLDNVAHEVVPLNFVLRRSKSRPLLYQYSITLQTVRMQVGGMAPVLPPFGSMTSGLGALDGVSGGLSNLAQAAGTVHAITDGAMRLAGTALGVINAARAAIGSAGSFVPGRLGPTINAAQSLSVASGAVFRTLAAAEGVAGNVSAVAAQMASGFNAAASLFAGPLRPSGGYQQFGGLNGASNGSSALGGASSAFAGQNIFSLLRAETDGPVSMTSSAISSMRIVAASDPVLSPMPDAELTRHMGAIVSGTVFE